MADSTTKSNSSDAASDASSATAAFDWADPFLLADQITAEERLVMETAAHFARDRLASRIKQDFREERFDPALLREMGKQGFLGATLPEELGGAGLGPVAYGLLAREIERVDSGYRTVMGVQHSLVAGPIAEFGSKDQQARYLPGVLSGETIGCFALTEADAGSDPGQLSTRAQPERGGYRLNGAKAWISNAPSADIALVWAKIPDQGLGCFIVERGMAGFSARETEGKFSLRASPTGEIALADCFVPEEKRLPGAKGFKSAFVCLNKARYSIVWGVLGAAEACFHAARSYTLDRRQFGKPLAANQLIQKKLADMQTEIALALQGALRLGRMIEVGRAPHELISLLKRNNCSKALHIAREARDMLGANGITDDFEVIRHMLNLEAVNTYEGASDIHALILGRAMTGLPAF